MSNDRWEYKVVLAPSTIWGASKPKHMTEALNREGAQGWELVNATLVGMRLHFFLKRAR
ncbi:MAG: DUF4177 domain-containing protein [Xanthomonadales bacterium]|nr:DUF4177 domain-containing protein [Xanthomonadales bacterium]